jgi:hypothetical protein
MPRRDRKVFHAKTSCVRQNRTRQKFERQEIVSRRNIKRNAGTKKKPGIAGLF